MDARPTTSMKKGWICRNSCDEKNDEIAPRMIQWWWSNSNDPDQVMTEIQWWWSSSDDPDRVMIEIQWWWSSSDDPNRVMIEIQWWSRSSDDPDPMMMSHDDPNREMIHIRRLMMTWRWRWIEDKDDMKISKTWDADDEMIQLIQRRRPVLKIVLKEYLPS